MKIRKGYVSNSSSSSFTCDLCGTTQSGYDMGVYEAGMMYCENGHCFCERHALDENEFTVKNIKRYFEENSNDWYVKKIYEDEKSFIDELNECENLNFDVRDFKSYNENVEYYLNDAYSEGHNKCVCPICSFEVLSHHDGFLFLKRKFNLTNEEILSMIREEFGSYEKMKEEFNKHVE